MHVRMFSVSIFSRTGVPSGLLLIGRGSRPPSIIASSQRTVRCEAKERLFDLHRSCPGYATLFLIASWPLHAHDYLPHLIRPSIPSSMSMTGKQQIILLPKDKTSKRPYALRSSTIAPPPSCWICQGCFNFLSPCMARNL